jgi:Tfp pilus assembly protein PilN
VGQIVDPVLQMRRLLERRKGDELTLLAQDPATFTVEVLREISLRVQARSRLRLTQLDLSGELLTLKGEADGYNTVEAAKDRWQQSPLLESVEIKSAKKNPKTGRWEFQCVAKRRVP